MSRLFNHPLRSHASSATMTPAPVQESQTKYWKRDWLSPPKEDTSNDKFSKLISNQLYQSDQVKGSEKTYNFKVKTWVIDESPKQEKLYDENDVLDLAKFSYTPAIEEQDANGDESGLTAADIRGAAGDDGTIAQFGGSGAQQQKQEAETTSEIGAHEKSLPEESEPVDSLMIDAQPQSEEPDTQLDLKKEDSNGASANPPVQSKSSAEQTNFESINEPINESGSVAPEPTQNSSTLPAAKSDLAETPEVKQEITDGDGDAEM